MANKGKLFPAEVYTSEELDRLLAAFPGSKTGVRNRALAATYIYSAVRCAEALDLAPGDVDLEACSVLVRHGKGGKRRCVGIGRKAIPHVQAWMACRPASPVLFCTHGGERLDEAYVRRAIKAAARRAGIARRMHIHGLRHSRACILADAGLDLRLISKQLGHARFSTTQTYLDHIRPQAVIEATSAV